MSAAINQSSLSIIKIPSQGTVKDLGQLAIPITLPFAVAGAPADGVYTLSMQNLTSRNLIDRVKTLWIDNSTNTSVLSISFSDSEQVINWPAGQQGYVEVLCPNPPSITFTSTGQTNNSNVVPIVSLLNYVISGDNWNSGISTLFNAQYLVTGSFATKVILTLPGLIVNPVDMLIELSTYVQDISGVGFPYTGSFVFALFYTTKEGVTNEITTAYNPPNPSNGFDVPASVLTLLCESGSNISLGLTITGTVPAINIFTVVTIIQPKASQ